MTHTTAPLDRKPRLDRAGRIFSLAELVVGGFIVVGHNVLHVLPNEVPILFALGLISLHLRDGSWKAAGFRRPESWWRTIVIAVCAAALLQLKSMITEPVGQWIWHGSSQPSGVFQNLTGAGAFLKLLAIVWTFAAFGEEIAYRGYLLRRAADFGNWSRAASAFALICSSVLFGLGHYYKGPPGVLESTVSGLILGGTYLLSRRVIWAPILAHGLSDTFAVIAIYLHW